ncbi:VapE domain-containing protein [Nostoc sp.]|uniref:VapE domain-containing protein n=1 Tax=Nostoc sp. TaxID=1180 RepID=UPI002FFBD0E1
MTELKDNYSISSATATLELPVFRVHEIATAHYDEWVQSAVSNTIISLNVRTITDSREIDKILNQNTHNRRKHSDHLVPAWCASGVDPLTDERTLEGAQVKPDSPPVGQDGRIQKYKGAKEFIAAPLFLYTGMEGYWKSIIDNILQAVIITEGPKKAGSGLTIGLPTISIPGVTTCRKLGRLHQLLKLFAVLGRTFYIAFDNDILKKPPVQQALIGLARELAARGSKIMVIMLPEGEAKGMDDFIALHGAEAFKQLVDEAATFEEWKEEIDSQVDPSTKPKKSRLSRNYQLIDQHWGDLLRYNALKKIVELRGAELPADDVRLRAALELDVDMTNTDALTVVRNISRDDSYSPVVDYLNEVELKFPEIDPSFLDGLAQEYFSTTDPMHSIYFKKFLVSAVARARKPGDKVDTVLMLASPKQGLYKSTFFRVLFGDNWFSDQLGTDLSDKDEKMKMHQYWCHEWAEFESIYKKKDVSALKSFITAVEDTFRAPYDRGMVTYQRPCVFVGTTNEQEILNDPTGNRRFWIIAVKKKIPIFEVMKNRDKIWAAANALYKSGFEWKLTDEQEERREILNEAYQSVDPWSEVIEEFILPGQRFVSTESLYRLLDIELSKRDPFIARRISSVMRHMGWISGREKINDRLKRGWILENIENKISSQTDDCNGSNGSACYERVLADPLDDFQDNCNGSNGSAYQERVSDDRFNESPMVVRDQPSTSVSNTTIRNLIPEIHVDPCESAAMDQLEPSDSKGDPLIHCSDDILAKNTNSTKQKIDYQFWLIDPTILTIAIPSQFGDINCTAEPTATIINRAKMKAGYVCRLTMYYPDCTKASLEDIRVEAATGKKDFEALAHRIAKDWAEEEHSELPAGWMHPEAIADLEVGSMVYIKNLRSGKWILGKIEEYCDRGGFLEVRCKGKLQKIFSVETIGFKTARNFDQ